MPRILLLEDNAVDAQVIEHTLTTNGVIADFSFAESRADYLRQLDNDPVDLIISDSSVPWLTALEALQISKHRQPHSSFLIVSGGMDEKSATEAKLAGAIEWISKTELKQLPSIAKLAFESSLQARAAANLKDQNTHLNLANQSVQRLVDAIKDLSKARDLPTVQAIVRRAAREITGADGATLVLRDNNQCFYVDEDAIGPLWKGQRFPIAACVSGWAMLHKKAAVIPDITLDPRIPLNLYLPTFVKSMVMMPIRQESPIGAIGNYWATIYTPTQDELNCLQALADSTSIALENVQLYEQLEQRVDERTAQLQDANESLEEFSYFVSHDLRAPVRNIGAFAEILETELRGLIQPQAQRALATIKASTVSMQAMLEGLLSLAQLGAGAIKWADVDMHLLATTAAQMAKEETQKEVEIKISTLPKTQGNALLLRQVWVNLLANAVKFSSNREHAVIEIGCTTTDAEIIYFVRDNGVGFDMAYADQLFGAFQRLHSVHEFPGVGVGLAIVHRIIVRHGGRVWAESQADKGASFYFAFPKNNPIACQ